MPPINQLAEQNIDLYESRLKHIDELLERSGQGISGHPEQADLSAQLAGLKHERDKFARHIDALKQGTIAESQEKLIEGSGLMGIWDALAQQLEKLVEHIER